MEKSEIASRELIWEKFVTCGEIENHIILPPIADSWLRCSKQGVNPDGGKSENILEYRDIADLLERKREIISIAKPFTLNLYRLFKNSGFILVLTDEHGYVMDSFGDSDSMENARNILRFVQGASWREMDVGTNAISVALSTGKPVQVSGAEHYCKKHHQWTCSAAPIYGYNGEIVAVLDLSGPAQAAYSHTLGMVAAAANAITMQFNVQQKNYELALMNKRLTSIFNTMSDGVILFDRSGIVRESNPIAAQLLGKKGKSTNGIPVDAALGGNNEIISKLLHNKEIYADLELPIDTERGVSRCVLSGETIVDGNGVISGGVIILRPVDKVHRLINKFSGHYTTFKFSDIIGQDPKLAEAIRQATMAANTLSNVVLLGESGTGKEMFAQAIHNQSSRRNGPFIALNCGAIPRELVGSELFGYEEGAFTGARRGGRPGNFELASGGTLFLDEIGDMPLEQQVAMLRVLQDRKVARIGGNKVIPVDVRIICATNKDLCKLVRQGTFRQDLYYRLQVFTINIPPLRERREDIELLFHNFVEQLGQEQGTNFRVAAAVWDLITRYDWPGNVRELRNVVERACNMAENGVITLSSLPPELFPGMAADVSPPVEQAPEQEQAINRNTRKLLMAEKERQEIVLLLMQEGGNISRVASLLGIARSTLYRKMRQYSIAN